jgi:hypothetical protein
MSKSTKKASQLAIDIGTHYVIYLALNHHCRQGYNGQGLPKYDHDSMTWRQAAKLEFNLSTRIMADYLAIFKALGTNLLVDLQGTRLDRKVQLLRLVHMTRAERLAYCERHTAAKPRRKLHSMEASPDG